MEGKNGDSTFTVLVRFLDSIFIVVQGIIYQGRQWEILYRSSSPPRWRYLSPCTAPWNRPRLPFPNWSSEMSSPCLFSDSPDRLSNRSISHSANGINIPLYFILCEKIRGIRIDESGGFKFPPILWLKSNILFKSIYKIVF